MIGPWGALALAVPVLLLGEALVRRVRFLSELNIPVPVVGGLSVALVVLGLRAFGVPAGFDLVTSASWWLWLLTPEPVLFAPTPPSQTVYNPLMVAFFATIGLGAHASVLRRGGLAIGLFLIASTVLAAVQMIVGAGVATALGESPLLGLLCGAISMTGGHATSAAFAPLVENAGLDGALAIAIAAATFGLVAGGLVGGPVGSFLIRRRRLANDRVGDDTSPASTPKTFLTVAATLVRNPRPALVHLAALAVCLKLGAWVSYGLESIDVGGEPVVLPGYLGAMMVGIVLRNALELSGRRFIQDQWVATWMFVCLGLFLAIAVMSIELLALRRLAIPMLVLLTAQVAVMILFAATMTFRIMGADYEAAVLAAGHCGFGLGASPNAVANMETLVKRFGAAPKAFLVLPISAGFLLDFTNAFVITLAIRFLDIV